VATHITRHFTDDELRCKCGCGELELGQEFMDFMVKVEAVRVAYDKPLKVSSGYRCPQHNNAISNTGLNGPHTRGAIDFAILGGDANRLLNHITNVGFSGIGIKQLGPHGRRFIHLDDLTPSPSRPRPWVWSY
jgi:uncharacterized protein YcbK (DUF882 family)